MAITRIMELKANKKPNTRRVERVLKIIAFLHDWRKIKEMQEHLQVSHKTVHCYINLLMQLGFEVECKFGKRHEYRIVNAKQFFNL